MYTRGLICLILATVLNACAKDTGPNPSRRPDASYNPNLEVSQFPNPGQLAHQFFVHQPGKVYVYAGQGEDGYEYIEVDWTAESTMILGIGCVTVTEDVFAGSSLIEQERSYYAEDADGNVWTLGVMVLNFNTSGAILNSHTSWMAGKDGAKPGLIMPADPYIGLRYRQEYVFNVAENQAEVVETGITVTTAMATFHDCIVIRERSELEPEILENKIYAPGVGLVKEVSLSTGATIELIDIR